MSNPKSKIQWAQAVRVRPGMPAAACCGAACFHCYIKCLGSDLLIAAATMMDGDFMNANYSHIPSPNNIYADGMAIGRPDPRTQNERLEFTPRH